MSYYRIGGHKNTNPVKYIKYRARSRHKVDNRRICDQKSG